MKYCSTCKSSDDNKLYHEITKTATKKYYVCSECRKEYAKKYWIKNKHKRLETNRAKQKEWYLKNKQYKLKRNKNWIINNIDKSREYHKLYERNKRKNNPIYRLHQAVSRGLRTVLQGKKNRTKWTEFVGYSIKNLKEHIENQFKEGMTWENYGKYGWHIDHIRPISLFNMTDSNCSDFKLCWSLANLQPLWAKDNLSKGAKY